MKTLFDITTENGPFYFDLFYFVAIGITGLLFMMDGNRKNYPMTSWSLIFATGVIFLIIGTKIATYSPVEWKQVFDTWKLPPTGKKNVLGGILGMLFGIGIAKKLIRFPHPVLDSFAVSFPIAMAAQSVGCFIMGCCFGTPTTLPWAVRYGPESHAWHSQLTHGWIDTTTALTVPIHPTQLYHTLICLLVALIVWNLRNAWKRPGNLFLTSLVLYWSGRFLIEFWQNTGSNIEGVSFLMGLKKVQWIILGTISILTLIITFRERSFSKRSVPKISYNNPVWFIMLLCGFALMTANWFTHAEFFFIESLLLLTILFQLSALSKSNSKGYTYWLASTYSLIFIMISGGVVTAQKIYNDLTNDPASRNTFNDLTLGYGNFKYAHYHSEPVLVYGYFCGYYYSSYDPFGPQFTQKSNAFGGRFNHIETYGKYKKLDLSGGITGGWDTDQDSKSRPILGIFDFTAHARYDFRWVGGGLGIHAGRAMSELKNNDVRYTLDHGGKSYTNLGGSIRVLPYDIVYLELRYNEMFPYQTGHRPGDYFQYIVGSGLGMRDGSGLELGFDNHNGYYFSGKAMIQNKYGLRASMYVSNQDHQKIQIPELSLTYRITGKHWSRNHTENE